MYSMTGFGRGTAPLGTGHVVIEMRTVNHRFLEIRGKAAPELVTSEPLIEKMLHNSLSRGHCTFHLNYEKLGGGQASIDTEALATHVEALKEVAKSTGVELPHLLPVLAGAPDIFSSSGSGDVEAKNEAVKAACSAALSKLVAMRQAEGEAMARDIAKKLDLCSAGVDTLKNLASDYATTLFDRYVKRLDEILGNRDAALDRGRLEAEVAMLADKADVNEEITRLCSHIYQMKTLIDSTQPIGRRMEFLIQEMGRETNTIGAKASLPELTHQVVELKTQLEKIRELVANVE